MMLSLIEIYIQFRESESRTLHLVLRPTTLDSSSVQNPASFSDQHSHPPIREPSQLSRLPPVPQLPEALRQLVGEERQRFANFPPEAARDIRIPTPPHFHPPPLPQPIRFQNGQAIPSYQGQHRQNPQLMETMRLLQELQQDNARLLQERLSLNQQYQSAGTPGTLPRQDQSQSPTVIPSFQNLVAQHQRDRAVLGMHGVQQPVAQQGSNAIPNAGRPAHPQSQVNRAMNLPQHNTRTSTQEVTGPNGERWTVTVNETTTVLSNTNGLPFQPRTNTEASSLGEIQNMVQNIVRAVDGNATAQQARPPQSDINSSSHLSLSASTRGGTDQPASVPSTNAFTSTSAPITINNTRATPQHVVSTTDGPTNTPTLSGPIVYILSSPAGPRGLLVSPSDNGFEAFYTPRRLVPVNAPRQNRQPQNLVQAPNGGALGLPELRNRREGRHGHVHRHENRHERRRAELPARAAPGAAHPANPPAGAVAQMWPHIWLVVRLLGFVWFFTSGSNSWWRLFMFSTVAFIIFIVSTGIFNGIAELVWGPIRRHLEALLPLAAPNGPRHAIPPNNPVALPNPTVGASAQGVAGGATGAASDTATALLDPAETAARLLEQRRIANENWIWTQFRRIEHATILFVASLVPGVGERHIAARAAEENLLLEAQRQRREAEAAAAVESARATEGGQESGGDDATTGVEEGSAPVQGQSETASEGNNAGDVAAPVHPVIDM